MRSRALHDALESRSPQAVAEALIHHRNTETQSETLLEVLFDSTAVEVKHIHAWAEDWLSSATNNALRAARHPHWQAMNTVYQVSAQALKASGASTLRERVT